MSARETELERFTAQLKLWNAELEHLDEKVRVAAGPASGGDSVLKDKLQLLCQLRDKAQQALQELETAGADDWEILQQRAEQSLVSLGEAFDELRSQFSE